MLLRVSGLEVFGCGGDFFAEDAFDFEEFAEDAEGGVPDADSAVAVAGPFYGEFFDSVAVTVGADDDLYVEAEAVGDALGVELFGHIGAIYLEAALGVGQVRRHPQPRVHDPPKRLRTYPAPAALGAVDTTALHLSRAVGDLALAFGDHVQPVQDIVIRHAAAAVGEHDVVADRLSHARADGAALAAIGLKAEDPAGNAHGRRDLLGGGGGVVLSSVVDDDDLARDMVVPEKGRGRLDVANDLLAFLEGRYDDR